MSISTGFPSATCGHPQLSSLQPTYALKNHKKENNSMFSGGFFSWNRFSTSPCLIHNEIQLPEPLGEEIKEP
jgi:hypothetical protein